MIKIRRLVVGVLKRESEDEEKRKYVNKNEKSGNKSEKSVEKFANIKYFL